MHMHWGGRSGCGDLDMVLFGFVLVVDNKPIATVLSCARAHTTVTFSLMLLLAGESEGIGRLSSSPALWLLRRGIHVDDEVLGSKSYRETQLWRSYQEPP